MRTALITAGFKLSLSLFALGELNSRQLDQIEPKLLVEVPGKPSMEPWSEGPVWLDGEVFFANRPFVRVNEDGKALAYLDLKPMNTPILNP